MLVMKLLLQLGGGFRGFSWFSQFPKYKHSYMLQRINSCAGNKKCIRSFNCLLSLVYVSIIPASSSCVDSYSLPRLPLESLPFLDLS